MSNDKTRTRGLMLLFMFTYLISYVTRINYSAVISEIVKQEGILKSTASLALTGSAITYGLGQLVSGYLGDKIQPKKIILTGLITTTAMNILIPFCSSPYQMAVLWSINGMAQAFMWPPHVKLMTCLFSEEDYKKAIVIVSWGSSIGTILVYLASPLCIYLSGWRLVFVFSAAAAAVMAAVWVIKCPEIELGSWVNAQDKTKTAFPWSLMLIGILLAIIIQGSLRDGVTTWMPSLISETFNLSNNISILTGVIFPVFSIIVFQIISKIYRKAFRNELILSGIMFAIGAVAALLLGMFRNANAVLTVIIAAALIGSMHGVNLMLICMLPPHFSKYGRISLISGAFNSFTYVGSALSAYGMAAYTENFGWNSMVFFWSAIALTGGIICLGFSKRWSNDFG